MPRRPAPLSLTTPPTPYRPLISSHLTIPISPSIPLTPLLPPARLHQRALLPSSSSSLPLAVHPPPPHPYPWIWRCHLCHSVYQLGVTRRCLEDGHFFCSVPSPPATPVDDGDRNGDRDGVPQRRRKRKRRVPRSCKAEFDYLGWERCNIWRREVRVLREVDGETDIDLEDDENKENASKGYECDGAYHDSRDCWAECDFPSECHNFRAERRRRRRQEKSEAEESREQEWEAVLAELEVQRLVKEMNGDESSESDSETESEDGDSSGAYENAVEDEEEESDEDDGIDGDPNMMFVDIYLGDEEDARLERREVEPESRTKEMETEKGEGQQDPSPSHSQSTLTTPASTTSTKLRAPTTKNPHTSWLALPTLTNTPSITRPHLRLLVDESSDAEVLFVERKRRKRISQLEASRHCSGEYKGGRDEKGTGKEPNSPLKMVVGVEDTDGAVEMGRDGKGGDEVKKSEEQGTQKRKVKLPGRRGAISRYA